MRTSVLGSRWLGGVALVAQLGLGGAAGAQTAKTFIDYIKPATPVCSPLSSATWGVAGVLPRDTCQGIESAQGAGVPPADYYWDGQIIKANDGKYHMFMSTWPGSSPNGFGDWTSSNAFHAVSSMGVEGPYIRQDYVYSSHKGHNVSAAQLLDGSYVVVVSEIVPFTIYKSTSLDGPWTACPGGELIQPNGVTTNSPTSCAPGGPCSDSHWDSNVSLLARPDGKFEIVQRHGFIALADTLCGPYKMQKPTWDYPTANRPNVDSIYPKRTSNPLVSNPTYGWEEDPHIWYSAGTYHVIYSGSGDRVGWHLYSPDGINHWKDGGLAYSPLAYQKVFCYEGSSTCTQWYKSERPGVVMENGHPTHITLAVADVDKDNQIPKGSNHGSKVVVLPFDGVAFDQDYGNAAAGASGSGGVTGTGGAAGGGAGSKGTGGSAGAAGGSKGTGGAAGGSKGTGGAGGVSGTGGLGSGGAVATGGSGGTAGARGTGGILGSGGTQSGGTNGAGGLAVGTGGAAGDHGSTTGTGGSATGGSGATGTGGQPTESGGASGCSCTVTDGPSNLGAASGLAFGLALLIRSRGRRRPAPR
jgi:MYXO-CTERM domain-containing protein